MGTVRSVLDVDVQSASWERFQKQWDAYSEQLRKQPEIWRKIGQQHEKMASGFSQFGNKVDAHLDSLREAQNVNEESEKSLTHSSSLWSDIEKASAGTTKNVISATTSLLKWSGLLSGLAGLAGYFTLGGIMDLGSSVFNWRKSSAGLGMSIGQQRAFSIATSRLLGSPGSFLSGVATAGADISSPAYRTLSALGVNPSGSTSDNAIALLRAIYAKAHSLPTLSLGPSLENPYQLGQFGIGLENLRNFQKMGPAEFNKQVIGTYQNQQGALNIGDRTARAWTDFITKMDTAKGLIETVFVKDLVNLSGPLANLTTSFAGLLAKIGQRDGPLSKDIDALATWITKLSGDLQTPGFFSSLETFISIVSGIPAAAKDLFYSSEIAPDLVSGAKSAAGGIGYAAGWIGANWDNWKDFWKHPGQSYQIEQRLKYMQAANKMDPTGLLGLVGWLESGMNPSAPDSSKGAEGMMQLMPGVAKSLGVNPYDPNDALRGGWTELQHLLREYNSDINKTLAAYNWGEGNLNADIAQHGANWQRYLPPETMTYLMRAIKAILSGAIKVDIVNATGANPVHSIAGLGAQR